MEQQQGQAIEDITLSQSPHLQAVSPLGLSCQALVGSQQLWPFPLWPGTYGWSEAVEEVGCGRLPGWRMHS